MARQFEKINHLTRTLHSFIYRDSIPVQTWRIIDRLPADVPLPEAEDPRWRELAPADLWGARMSWAWLTSEIVVPDEFAGKPVALHIEFEALANGDGSTVYSAPEALVIVNGGETPLQALNESHPDVLLAEQAAPGLLQVTLACFTGVSLPGEMQVRLKVAEMAWIDRDVEALFWDGRILLDAITHLPAAAPERSAYLRVLDQAFKCINWLNPPDKLFDDSIREARAVLQRQIDKLQSAPEYDGQRPVVHAVGHAHIDLAWLWPLHVTRGKALRTFATAVALMDQFPTYQFTQSQPPLYKMVADDAPDLLAQIKKKIAAGQWNATGATWVEMDANLPSGESLVRQFLYGMRYFQQELGVRPQVLWLPDGFGFTAALPQIMQQVGIRYFFTNKLSWNSHSKFPFDTFWWEGLDGSRVLAHLGTTPETLWDVGRERNYTTYVAQMTPEEIVGTWTRYRQQAANRHLLIPFGMGDGGGGPNRAMLERRVRMENLPGLPQVKHNSAEGFFRELEVNLAADLPRWVGELYLQFHRGTYTTHGRTKRFNRRGEVLLHDAEALATILHLLQQPYPQAELQVAWETLLLNQFHDILPGSSIRDVHEEAERAYQQMQDTLDKLIAETVATLAENISGNPTLPTFAIFNTLGTTMGGLTEATLPGDGPVKLIGQNGERIAYQWLDISTRRALLLFKSVPAYGYSVWTVSPKASGKDDTWMGNVAGTPTSLENNLLLAEFDDAGNLVRLFDHENQRDVLAEGAIGNQLWAYVDRPHQFDAWEVESFLHDQGWQLQPTSSHLVENGPLRVALEVTYRFHQSQIKQRISLVAGQRLLTFATEVDWHERHIMLQTHFPLAIRTMNATYEIQFGSLERPTHRNTIWDETQFEVPAQQWVDMSEAGYGVSLLNDGKYGHSAEDNILTLSLLRSPTDPDPEADQGRHQFSYALYPHAGDEWRQDTLWQARRLNHPLYIQGLKGESGQLPSVFSLVQSQTPGVVIDTVKKAEDNDAFIVRVYEATGGRHIAGLLFPKPVVSAAEVNLLEEILGEADIHENTLAFHLAPYQIRSFQVQLVSN